MRDKRQQDAAQAHRPVLFLILAVPKGDVFSQKDWSFGLGLPSFKPPISTQQVCKYHFVQKAFLDMMLHCAQEL